MTVHTAVNQDVPKAQNLQIFECESQHTGSSTIRMPLPFPLYSPKTLATLEIVSVDASIPVHPKSAYHQTSPNSHNSQSMHSSSTAHSGHYSHPSPAPITHSQQQQIDNHSPIFTTPSPSASENPSSSTALTCFSTNSGGVTCTSLTPMVFWAVRAVVAVMAKTPCAVRTFWSASRPLSLH